MARVTGQTRAAFYCVSSGVYFLGAVALINSLRLQGHEEQIFVLDLGLEPEQRRLLGSEATLVPAPEDVTPFLLKTVAPSRYPADVMVLIDADIIVTRPLDELIDRAASGRLLAVRHGFDRSVPEWGSLLGLSPTRERPYVSSSLIVAGGETGSRVIRLMHEARFRIGIDETPYSGSWPDFDFVGGTFSVTEADHPFFFADQDLLNAVLASEVDPDDVEMIDRRLEATVPFAGLRVVDERRLRCAYEDGTAPYAVHHILPVKPWIEPTIPGVYTELLVRLLGARDVAIRVPRRLLPLHLRPGLAASAERWVRGPFAATVAGASSRLRGGHQESNSVDG
jgi:hypothetical protein